MPAHRRLNADIVYFEVEVVGDIVMVRAVRNAASMLREFSSKVINGLKIETT